MMSAQNAMRLTKTVKKLEKPRPLKVAANQNRHSVVDSRLSSVEDVMALADAVSMHIMNGNYDKVLQTNICTLCTNLKIYGSQLEAVYKDQLDRAYVVFRNGCRDDRLDVSSRIQLLELIELRATNWSPCDNMNSYYKPKLSTIETEIVSAPETPTHPGMTLPLMCPSSSPTTVQPPVLSPGEVIKTSGKFAKPTKIPGKNYCKDEVVIRNSDSGKVSPGAKERLVQITGPAEDKINYAKQLMEDTIRRNASPVRLEQAEKERVGGSSSSLNSSASDDSNRLAQGMNRTKLLHSFSTNDASLGEYKYTVTVGNHSLKITGTNLDLVRTAKLVLDEYFSGEPEQYIGTGDFFTAYEDEAAVSVVGSATPVGNIPSRVGSMDSAATSESEETFKASVTTASEIKDSFHETNSDGAFMVLRQPLFPDASKEAFEQAEASGRSTDVNARNRRALFALTNQQQSNLESQPKSEGDAPIAPRKVRYSREFLLHLALSSFSCETPADWEQISSECPAIIKKATEPFDPVIYSQKWQETEMHSVICATEIDSADPE
ncbi:hypothetical protein R5R35_007291 [Gryllus longicercus]|uniref:Eukaryotic translation initiation factor 4E-binding protein Mextli n=1 Tax=Gryllus longicercus TaxID=2509291 RepID=A0AAN9VE27_9ORTH|nr:Eukaryotic translation initiation factor 4E-binding protein Mextli [Gryllus bimaculatus]